MTEVYVNFRVTVGKSRYSRTSEEGYTELSFEIDRETIEGLDVSQLLTSMLKTAIKKYDSALAGEAEEK